MADIARIAFVGAGNHATQSLYPNLPTIPEFELVAVCDLKADRAEHLAHKYGAPDWFTDVEVMLDQVQPQGVCVVGPAEMHHAVGLQVLARGIPLWCEKPPADDLAGAQELVDAARAAGTWGMVGFMKRFAPANVVAREYMLGDEFGPVSTINLIHGAGPYRDVRRMLYFNAIHMIDLARYFGGEVAEVTAMTFSDGANGQAVAATFRFASGALGQLNTNSGRDWSDCFEQVYISGGGGSLVVDASASVEVMSPSRRFAQSQGQALFGWSGRYYVSGNLSGWASGSHYTRGYCGELEHFAKAVLGQVTPGPTLEDGAEAVRLIEAMLDAAR